MPPGKAYMTDGVVIDGVVMCQNDNDCYNSWFDRFIEEVLQPVFFRFSRDASSQGVAVDY